MHNPVVETIASAYRRTGFTTLKFNFRGVGKSQGHYDDGVGEQKDVHAAVAYLSDHHFTAIDLAGYSFGAWVNARAVLSNLPIGKMVMVSPPVGLINFETVGAIGCLQLVITGSRDDIAPADIIRQHMPVWNKTARLEIIANADHFYTGCLEILSHKLHAFLE